MQNTQLHKMKNWNEVNEWELGSSEHQQKASQDFPL